MHNSQRMFESSMHRTGINLIRPTQLTDTPQTLKRWLGDNLPLPVVQRNETMHRAANFILAMRVSHALVLFPTILYTRIYVKPAPNFHNPLVNARCSSV